MLRKPKQWYTFCFLVPFIFFSLFLFLLFLCKEKVKTKKDLTSQIVLVCISIISSYAFLLFFFISSDSDRPSLMLVEERFAISKSALLNVKGSYFDAMVSSGYWLPNEEGEYFIDRNPKAFGIIMDYLRTGEIDKGELTEKEIKFLEKDLQYYFPGLQVLSSPPVAPSPVPSTPGVSSSAVVPSPVPSPPLVSSPAVSSPAVVSSRSVVHSTW